MQKGSAAVMQRLFEDYLLLRLDARKRGGGGKTAAGGGNASGRGRGGGRGRFGRGGTGGGDRFADVSSISTFLLVIVVTAVHQLHCQWKSNLKPF